MDSRTTGRGGKTYGSDNRIIVGNFDNGGLADVNNDWPDNSNENVAFRVLAVLTQGTSTIRRPSFRWIRALRFLSGIFSGQGC